MSELTDKAKGLGNKVAGKIKQGLGDATGSEKTRAEGEGQEAKGSAQKTVGDVKGAVKNTASKVADAADDAVKGRR